MQAEVSEGHYLFQLKTFSPKPYYVSKAVWQNSLNRHQPSQYIDTIRNFNILYIQKEKIQLF